MENNSTLDENVFEESFKQALLNDNMRKIENAPSPEPVVIASIIPENQYKITLKKDVDTNIKDIHLYVENNDLIFENIFSINSEFWQDYKDKFMNNFDIFYDILVSTFIKKDNNNLTYNISEVAEVYITKTLNLYIKYETEFFGFDFNIILNKKKDVIDIQTDKIKSLETKIESLETKIESFETKIESFETKIESLCKIVDMMGPQYMRNIIGADKLYANYNFLGTMKHDPLPYCKLGRNVSLEPIKFINELQSCEKSHSTGGIYTVNENKEMDWNHNGNGADALVWSKTAWDLIKKDKQWNID
jgi:hypothetical protein